ncbi:1,3-beta-galactosyl-N-acetylhexosamine phosphorylase [uncultured Faecalicoccus sp.]|uniref:1,3-beta-galactosyl-N-acetylhexosamine phosphorylase n=1 Tax=uncultured Faecalicoccus sp. TaxID=1971760 RepID=UPI0025E33274|nr:1,3-beta-galactosyl-N-acetylhexosamine phosphorylase [uncultured Faecalicoccus sp.]
MINKGRVTVPTDVDVIDETIDVINRWKADAIRDCDGTDMPEELRNMDIKQYATYYTTRKDNEWAKANPDEIQQMYLMSDFITAKSTELKICIMKHFYADQLKPNTIDDIHRWWEVIDRTTDTVISDWDYDEETREVTIHNTIPYHAYTVSFLAFVIWDPVHMYNSLTNEWEGEEHQMTYDVRQPKTQKYVLDKFRRFCQERTDVNVVRFTTFFHQFTLQFDEKAREKYVDWFGYSASVSPYILKQFEEEVGYPFRPEYIINKGFNNSTFCVPTKEYLDFMDFQQREVCKLAKKFVDICHEYGKEAMMFLGDHWIGTEPYGKYFSSIGLDAVVGSVGSGTTLRLISDIEGVKYTEGRFLPYFFPDTFYDGGDPLQEAKINWVTARRAILRSPVDRIGYGGYLKLALKFPEFIDYIEKVCDEFRELYSHINQQEPYTHMTVGVLNSWGELRRWGTHLVHHAIWYKQIYSYTGVMEALSGFPFHVRFISFDDIRKDPDTLNDVDVLINVGSAYTSFSGGEEFDETIISTLRRYVDQGGGFIGVGEPTACAKNGKYFTLYDVLGVDEELGFTLHTDKYNWDSHDHFIVEQLEHEDWGECINNVYALPETTVIRDKDLHVNLACNEYGKGRSVYINGLPFSFENTRLLYRAIYYAAHKEDDLKKWYSDNYNLDVNVYPSTNSFCVVNNTYEPQKSMIYKGDGSSFEVDVPACGIQWFDMD